MLKIIISAMLIMLVASTACTATDVEEEQKFGPRVDTPRQPQRPYGMPFRVNIPVLCNDSKVVDDYLTQQHKEMIISYGVKLEAGRNMGVVQITVAIYANPQTRTFSIVHHTLSGVSCIITSGNDFDIQIDALPREKS